MEHKHAPKGFVKKYGLDCLLDYEWVDGGPTTAIIREKQIKNMSRADKLTMIEEKNPLREDLAGEVLSLADDRKNYPICKN